MNYNYMDAFYARGLSFTEYVVKKGDSLFSIAEKYKTSVQELIDINMLTSTVIFPDQVLMVPNKVINNDYEYEEYITKENDTIESIAEKFNVNPVVLGLFNDFGALKLMKDQKMMLPNEKETIKKEYLGSNY